MLLFSILKSITSIFIELNSVMIANLNLTACYDPTFAGHANDGPPRLKGNNRLDTAPAAGTKGLHVSSGLGL